MRMSDRNLCRGSAKAARRQGSGATSRRGPPLPATPRHTYTTPSKGLVNQGGGGGPGACVQRPFRAPRAQRPKDISRHRPAIRHDVRGRLFERRSDTRASKSDVLKFGPTNNGMHCPFTSLMVVGRPLQGSLSEENYAPAPKGKPSLAPPPSSPGVSNITH